MEEGPSGRDAANANTGRPFKKPNPRIFEYRLPTGVAEKDLDQPPETP